MALVPGGPADLSKAVRYNQDVYPAWGRLADLARTGEPVESPQLHLGDDPERTRRFALSMRGRSAVIEGVDHLTAASVQAYDLRAGAAMVIAALAAEGTSEVSNVHYIERGYEDIIGKLRNLGAQINSVECDETVETRQIG